MLSVTLRLLPAAVMAGFGRDTRKDAAEGGSHEGAEGGAPRARQTQATGQAIEGVGVHQFPHCC
jgi:hypothetical protein